jgi:hypothetical protein
MGLRSLLSGSGEERNAKWILWLIGVAMVVLLASCRILRPSVNADTNAPKYHEKGEPAAFSGWLVNEDDFKILLKEAQR